MFHKNTAAPKDKEGLRIAYFFVRGKGTYKDIRDRNRDTQKGRKMRPYMPFGDSIGNRTRVTAVKGRCLNRLTMEPYKQLLYYSKGGRKLQPFCDRFFGESSDFMQNRKGAGQNVEGAGAKGGAPKRRYGAKTNTTGASRVAETERGWIYLRRLLPKSFDRRAANRTNTPRAWYCTGRYLATYRWFCSVP